MNAKQQLEAKFWLSLVIALWTIVGMALPLIVGEYSFMSITIGSVSESGFHCLSFSSAVIEDDNVYKAVGGLCLGQLVIGACMALSLIICRVTRHPFTGRTQLIAVIVAACLQLLYLVDGFILLNAPHSLYDIYTLSYIPLIADIFLTVLYFLIGKKRKSSKEAQGSPLQEDKAPQENRSTPAQEADGALYCIDGNMGKILRVYDDRISLQVKKNVRSVVAGDYLLGTKEIYYSDMLGMQYKPAGKFISGYMQFETATSYARNNFKDENSFPFDGASVTNEQAAEMADFIREKIRGAHRKDAQTVVVGQTSAPLSAADELKKFKELLDAGVITQEEFDERKKQLLH